MRASRSVGVPAIRAAAAAAALASASIAGSWSSAAAQSADARIAEAVRPAPAPLRPGATVLGHVDGELVTLREGEGPMICLADDPAEEGFHVACYHESLEPYMARGRELRLAGVSGRESIARRWEEIEAGSLPFPEHAVLYSLSSRPPGEEGGGSDEPMALTVVYLKGATAEELGVPTNPADGIPWVMFPGKPTAHLMIHEPPRR